MRNLCVLVKYIIANIRLPDTIDGMGMIVIDTL